MNRNSQVIKGEKEPKLDQGTHSMCSRSSIKSFGSSDLQFLHKTWYLTGRNQCYDIQNQYRTILERSLNIWFKSGRIGNLKIIPILAGLMIALTSLFLQIQTKQIKSKVTNSTHCQALMQQKSTIPSTSF